MREFRPLFGSYLLSTVGDELARVALSVLVYQRTDSPLLSAVTFGISYLPWVLVGPLLAALADRLPRHRVLISSDLVRAGLVGVMAVPHVPLAALLVLLLLVSLASPPFEAARSALMADVLSGGQYAVATSLTGITQQVSQLVGFVLGGELLARLSASGALLLDAATFLVSAVWLGARLTRRPAATAEGDAEVGSIWRDTASGVRFLAGSRRLVAIVGLLWVAALFVNAPEGIAAPWAVQLTGGTAATGLLLAANPAGTAVGGVVLARWVPPRLHARLLAPLVALALGGVLLAGLVPRWCPPGAPALVVALVLLFVAGLGGACNIPLNVAFVQAVPAAFRGRAFGVAVAGLSGVQGLGVVLAGLGAEVWRPGTVVALAGAVGLVAVVGPLVQLARTPSPPPGGEAADPGPVAGEPDAGGRSTA